MRSKRDKIDLDQFGDIEATPKRKKKNDPLEKLRKSLTKHADDADTDTIPSVFEDSFVKIREMLSIENSDPSLDMTTPAFLRSSLLMLTDIVPILERAVRKRPSQTAVYALSAVVNQIREIQGDLKVVEDVETKAINIKRIVDSTFLGAAQLLLQEKYALQNKINSLTNDTRIRNAARAEIDNMVRSTSLGLQEHATLLSDRVRALLMGVQNYMRPAAESEAPKRKKKRKRPEEEM